MFWGFGKKKAPRPANTLPYRAYTEKFDLEIQAADLAKEYRENDPLGSLSHMHDVLLEPTVSRLKAVQRSMAFQTRFQAGHDLGERPCFTVLLDHSGSMKGPKAMTAAVAADVASDLFDHQRGWLDVLGFTTRSWKGGQSRKLWVEAGCPEAPGRLCDLAHIVYRDAAQPGSGRRNLALMLEPDYLKENVDGEALLWARRRIERLSPTAWVCILVSDGAPIDDSTIEANGGPATGWYFNEHLKSVVEEFNADPRIRLGCLSLDREPLAPFRAVEQVTALDAAPVQLWDLMDRLIWPVAADAA